MHGDYKNVDSNSEFFSRAHLCNTIVSGCTCTIMSCVSSSPTCSSPPATTSDPSPFSSHTLFLFRPRTLALLTAGGGGGKYNHDTLIHYTTIIIWHIIQPYACNRYSMRPSVLWNIQARARGRVAMYIIKHEDFSCYMCFISRRPRTYCVIIKYKPEGTVWLLFTRL